LQRERAIWQEYEAIEGGADRGAKVHSLLALRLPHRCFRNDGSFMSNFSGSAMCDHTPAAKKTTLPAASVEGASFAGRQGLIDISGHSYRAL
jgi:hypothetical protein